METTKSEPQGANSNRLKGKRVTVMGLGLHGGALGNIQWLHDQGAKITVTDLKTEQELAATVRKLNNYPDIQLVLGQHRAADFTDTDLVLKNPAVPRESEYLQAAREAGVPVEMDSSLFFQFCPSTDVIGVTGSKGKTTTANAIAIVLKSRWPQTVEVGMDGVSPLVELPTVHPDSPVVFELSSWRLEALAPKQISPRTAVVTSLLRDHLNTYTSFEEYIDTKKTIIRFQTNNDRALLNADDERLRSWAPAVAGQLFWFGTEPIPAGDGIWLEDGSVHMRLEAEQSVLFPATCLPLPAVHERRSLLSAILIARLRGIDPPDIAAALRLITRLPHRLEIVRTVRGVVYINDSAATMPDATMAALQHLHGKSIVHILGGSDKALLFEGLARQVAASRIRALLFLPGTATENMKNVIQQSVDAAVPIHDAADMNEAVRQAARLAQSGDTVLLSPGATSFGLFAHEFDRGNKFRAAVQAL